MSVTLSSYLIIVVVVVSLCHSDFMDQECNIRNIVNAIYSVDIGFNREVFRSHFKIPKEFTRGIRNEECVVRMIELWYENTVPADRTWEKLQEGLILTESLFESSMSSSGSLPANRTASSASHGVFCIHI